MRPLMCMSIAVLCSGPAVAQPLEPEMVDVKLREVVPMRVVENCVPSSSAGVPGALCHASRIEVPDYDRFFQKTGDGRTRLGDFIKKCIITAYGMKGLSDGYYFGDPIPDDVLNDLPGIRMKVIVPSELFRDSYTEWDGFQVLAGLEFPTDQKGALDRTARLSFLAVSYTYRGRGGITWSGPTPSPDWEYNSLSDDDATNGRLRRIQEGIKLHASVVANGGWN